MLLTKPIYALPFLAVLCVVLFIEALRPGRKMPVAIAVVAATCLATPYLASVRFGASSVLPKSLVAFDITPYWSLTFLRAQFSRVTFPSYWGMFGWLDVSLPSWQYLAFAVAAILAVCFGTAFAVREILTLRRSESRFETIRAVVTGLRRGNLGESMRQRLALWLLVAIGLLYVAATSYSYASVHFVGFQGRYFFATVFCQMLILTLAFHRGAGRAGPVLVAGLIGVEACSGIHTFTHYLALYRP